MCVCSCRNLRRLAAAGGHPADAASPLPRTARTLERCGRDVGLHIVLQQRQHVADVGKVDGCRRGGRGRQWAAEQQAGERKTAGAGRRALQPHAGTWPSGQQALPARRPTLHTWHPPPPATHPPPHRSPAAPWPCQRAPCPRPAPRLSCRAPWAARTRRAGCSARGREGGGGARAGIHALQQRQQQGAALLLAALLLAALLHRARS
jgi:hypothetical protein